MVARQSMVTFSIDGTPKVASMTMDTLGEFFRVPAKAGAASGAPGE